MPYALIIDPDGWELRALLFDFSSFARDYVKEKKVTKPTLMTELDLPADVTGDLHWLLEFADHWDCKGLTRAFLGKLMTDAWKSVKSPESPWSHSIDLISFSQQLSLFLSGIGAAEKWERICKALQQAVTLLAQKTPATRVAEALPA
jgi:hypothetical protein